MLLNVILIVFVFALGACLGSFLNVVIYRLPRGESIVFPASHCPGCGRPIRGYDNIPILSWLILRGRCRSCGVSISPQYILVELATGLMLAGLYICYFVLKVRTLGYGRFDIVEASDLQFIHAWPMFLAYAALLCSLLACALVDIKYYMVPLPVMWTAAVFGAAAAAFRPHPFLPHASAGQTAASLAASVGIALSILLTKMGYLIPSFIDASPHPTNSEQPEPKPKKGKKKGKSGRRNRGSVAFTSADGINPRREILREVLFLTPCFILAIAAWAILHFVPSAGTWWSKWFNPTLHPELAPRLGGVGGSLFGFLIGGAWVWGIRIFGTLAFGREAMGLGDVHILAGVGAVTGWVVPSIAFFVAPVSGLLFVIYLLISRRQKELPYGPWLALGTVLVLLFYDAIIRYLSPGLTALAGS